MVSHHTTPRSELTTGYLRSQDFGWGDSRCLSTSVQADTPAPFQNQVQLSGGSWLPGFLGPSMASRLPSCCSLSLFAQSLHILSINYVYSVFPSSLKISSPVSSFLRKRKPSYWKLLEVPHTLRHSNALVSCTSYNIFDALKLLKCFLSHLWR